MQNPIETACLHWRQLKTVRQAASKWYKPRFWSPSCSLQNSHWLQLLLPLGTHKHCSQPSVSRCTGLSQINPHISALQFLLCFKPLSILTIVVRVFFVFFSPLNLALFVSLSPSESSVMDRLLALEKLMNYQDKNGLGVRNDLARYRKEVQV